MAHIALEERPEDGVTAPAAPEPYAAMRETHSGVVLLAGERAYKFKKPVTTAFLDFSTHEAREFACAREAELNRRLSPDVYLGVAHLTDPVGGPAEPVVVMRRMPETARLSTLVGQGAPVGQGLAELALALAGFHRWAQRGPQVAAQASVKAIRGRWQANLAEISLFSAAAQHDGLLDHIQQLALRYLRGRKELFAERIARGRIVDGHGDLIADDVFLLPEGPRALDCLDFDDRLRFVDGADDAAFLAMDLEYLGRPDLGQSFLEQYLAEAEDDAPRSLLHHYIAYRALVRAKVDYVRLGQGHAQSRAEALRHLRLAADHLERGAARLVLIGGLPGTGKSTLAAALAGEVGAAVVSSDEVRHELKESGEIAGEAGQYGRGLYAPEAAAKVYRTMLDRARGALAGGASVVLDASWVQAEQRELAARLAEESSAALVELRCVAPQDVAWRRIAARRQSRSDATAEIARDMAADMRPWPTSSEVDTAAEPGAALRAALEAWVQAARHLR
nr:bifunctional aminoglycoside phosphotransferase/ATP-binding protein [Segniliparus rugosus]